MGRRRWMAAVLLAGLAVAGCSSGDMATDDAGFDTTDDAMTDSEMSEDSGATGGSASALSVEPQSGEVDDMAADMPSDEAAQGDGGGDEVVTFGGSGSAVSGRALARTASVVLEVESIEQAATRVTAAAQRAGGFVAQAQVTGGDFDAGSLTLRVPAERLDATIEDLADVGLRVVESSISTEDLTDQLTDLGARISNLERLESELQLLLADVRDGDPEAQQLLTVFERLNNVRGEIERLEAQRAGAQERVALATVNVELLPTSTAPEELQPDPESTLEAAWETTKDAFGAMGDAAIWLGVTILPVLLVVLGIPALLVWAALRTRRRLRADGTNPGGSGPATPSGGTPTPMPPATSPDPADDPADTPSDTPGDDREPANV